MNDVNTFTERLLRDAGIVSGMKVIDAGCGNGEVTFLVAKLVGPEGLVLGIDQDEQSVAAGKEGAAAFGYSNVRFMHADLSGALPDLARFDAAVGRRVLMYLPDPATAIRRLARALRPGGLLVFQESDSTMVPSRLNPLPLHDQVVGWIWKTVEREGANIHMGFNLPSVFQDAGVVAEHIRAESVIQGQGMHHPLAFIIRAMLPRITNHGVASESEIEIETLEQRLAAERPADVVYVSDTAFGGWGHTWLSEDERQ